MTGLRRQLGAVLYDWPRFLRSLAGDWRSMRNRNERVTRDGTSGGVKCEWQFTSDLHIVNVFPFTAQLLMRRALREWPIRFAEAPTGTSSPRVSFVIGHRGTARMPLLLASIATIAAQRDVPVECIVVEQSDQSILPGSLPRWVRHLHTPVAADRPYNRSAAFNAGAEVARAPLLVFHDNDMLVPERYGAELAKRHAHGAKVVDLKRFIFYLDQNESARVLDRKAVPRDARPVQVMQNSHGASTAADRETFFAIGRFDEEFVGWGGEDNEFWERAETTQVWDFAYLPFVHLWHPAQPEKTSPSAPGIARFRELGAIPAQERIARLVARR